MVERATATLTGDEAARGEQRDEGVITKGVRFLERHPIFTVSLIGVAFVVYQWWWISNARFPGAMESDEQAGIVTALAFHRALMHSPSELLRATLSTGNGPLVPLFAVPFVAVFGRSAISPLLVQPVLVAVTAVAVCGATARLATERSAIVAGITTLAMPALIVSSRTGQFSTGVGAMLCLAIWALLASDRGRRTLPMVGLGLATGAMTLTRTMSISFLPAIGIAAILVVDVRERKVRRNITIALCVMLATALPWWIAQWDYVSAYLLRSGYGDHSGYFGPERLVDRVGAHLGYLLRDLRTFVPVGVFVAALALVQGIRGVRHAPRTWFVNNRELIAVWLTVAVGSMALWSSSNRGIWFSTPIDALLIVAVVSSGARLFKPGRVIPVLDIDLAVVSAVVLSNLAVASSGLGLAAGYVVLAIAVLIVSFIRPTVHGGTGRGLCGLTMLLCVATIAASTSFVGSPNPTARSATGQLVGTLESTMSTVHEVDPRQSSTDMATRRRVAAEWDRVSDEVESIISGLEASGVADRSDSIPFIVTGSRGLFHLNTVALGGELGPRGRRWLEEPDTFRTPDAELLASLAPRSQEGHKPVLIAIEGRSAPFPNSLGWHRLVQLARADGWVPRGAVPLPDGGRVVVYASEPGGDQS